MIVEQQKIECTASVSAVFVLLVVVYGSSSAMISEGLKYFEMCSMMLVRYVIAFLFCFSVLLIRLVLNFNNFRETASMFFQQEKNKVKHLLVAGVLTTAIPVSLISAGQKYVTSATIQIMNPVAIASGAVFGHFWLDDEKFTLYKLYSLIAALAGVGMTSIPLFNHARSNPNVGIGGMIQGFSMVFFGLVVYGMGPVYLKKYASKVDISLSVTTQFATTVIFYLVWVLGVYGFSGIKILFDAPIKGWTWPIVLGLIVSGLCIHGYMYLLEKIGSFGSNLLPFGQIIVGVVTGVVFLNEWANYLSREVYMSIFGIVFICFSIWLGISNDKKENESGSDQVSTSEEIEISEI